MEAETFSPANLSASVVLDRPTATGSTPIRHSRMSHSQAQRTSTACQTCRDKKVKCSGAYPCLYCSKRRLKCVFLNADNNRRLYSGQERDRDRLPQPHHALSPQQSTNAFQESIRPSGEGVTYTSPSLLNPPTNRSQSSHNSLSPLQHGGMDDVSSKTSNRAVEGMAPQSALSSSETFGSEVNTLLARRFNMGSSSASAIVPLPQVDTRNWPSEEEAQSILETVVLNVGISQQLFDVRAFSDNLSLLYEDSNADAHVPRLWIVQVLLVFAIGRLLHARADDNSDISQPPGTAFFNEAMGQLPHLTELRRQGLLGIEVVGLGALYLQIVDRKEDAYIYASTALRLAIGRGMHRANSTQGLRRSEAVHGNRLWWTIYMQERRLAATGGHPMAIADDLIHSSPPSDFAGFPSATAIAVNVRAARIVGQITSTIYSQNSASEASFISNVQSILSSLHDVENTMPAEYSMDFRQPRLLLAGRPFSELPAPIARTSASLHLSIYQAVIYAVRPVLLHLARNSREKQGESQNEPSPTLKQLAEICVQAASKSLVILQHLREQDILAKHAFLDLDAIFSVGFVFVLVEAVNPGKELGLRGIDGSRALLRYLVTLGNLVAAKRLAEIDQMCTHLSLPLLSGYGIAEQFHSEAPVVNPQIQANQNATRLYSENLATGNGNYEHAQQVFGNADMSNISLEGGNDLYWVYHDPEFSFTGVDQADWETLENQITWS